MQQPVCSTLVRSSAPMSPSSAKQVGCKICLEDLPKDIDRHVTEGQGSRSCRRSSTRASRTRPDTDRRHSLLGRLRLPRSPSGGTAGAAAEARSSGPDGVLLAFFSTAEPRSAPRATYTKHVVVDRTHLQYRSYSGGTRQAAARCSTVTSSGSSSLCGSPKTSCSRTTCARCCSASRLPRPRRRLTPGTD